MSMMKEKDIKRRVALCKALFLAPVDIFTHVDRYIEINLNTFIEEKTGRRPSKNFPLDFWTDTDKDRLPTDPYKIMDNLTDKNAKERAELCKLIFLIPPSMFRRIETYYNLELKTYIEEKTGKKPNSKFPLDFWVHKTPYNSNSD